MDDTPPDAGDEAAEPTIADVIAAIMQLSDRVEALEKAVAPKPAAPAAPPPPAA